ncbi:MAG TPA: AAA family ATPase [Acidimicrobiales bacterium]|nr:AAA family ATPase [Acidimicrobiales bacterium]
MLSELRVRDLGVIADVHLLFEAGMTALTGETGAGKTLLVEAIELLLGGRADPVLVRPGAAEAWVEGRFVTGDDEVVLARAVPASGRSRAYIDGRMVPVAALGERGAALVDLHGQHAHQSLLSGVAQRAALDAFGGIDLRPFDEARARVRTVDAQLAELGGDERARTREIDLLRFQVDEIDSAAVADADEDTRLSEEEDRLADATAHREAAAAAYAALTDDGGVSDGVGVALGAVSGRAPLAELETRLRSLAADVAEVAADLRAAADDLEDNPERLAAIRTRRELLHQLQRKYGATLDEVLAFGDEARTRLAELESHDQRAAALDAERAVALAEATRLEEAVWAARGAAAPKLAAAVEEHLRELAMPKARFEVVVDDAVTFLLGANPGEPALPLSKVASGGELARSMLACRLALRDAAAGGAPTVVFDEVDAGIGGAAALAVGRSLAALADPLPERAPSGARSDSRASGFGGGAPPERNLARTQSPCLRGLQVLVVTHLPQVAAFADRHVAVRKDETDGRTVASAAVLDSEARVAELSRMLSGMPESESAREHAAELLAGAARERRR